jgi:hypothetical protein
MRHGNIGRSDCVKKDEKTVRTINLQRIGQRGRRMKKEQTRMLQPTARK